MMKYQVLICALLVTYVSAGWLSNNERDKDKGTGLRSKAKALFFGSKSQDEDEDEYQPEELSFAEEEASRKKATIDEETMTKMADVNNDEIPVLSLDEVAAIVDKGVDFSRPFDVKRVKNTLASVVREKLPQDTPYMKLEELFSLKDDIEQRADPEASKAFAEEKKEASSKTKPSTKAPEQADTEPSPPAESPDPAPEHVDTEPSPAEPSDPAPEHVDTEPSPAEPSDQAPEHVDTEPSPAEPSDPSSSEPGFFEKAKMVVEETAQKVGEEAEHLVVNLKRQNTSGSDDDKPADGAESGNDEHSSSKRRRRPKIQMQ